MPSSPHLAPNLETLNSTPPVFHTRVKNCSPPAPPTPLGIPAAIRQQTYYRCRHACTHTTALPTFISLHYCPRWFSCCPALPFRPISTLSFPPPPHLPIWNPFPFASPTTSSNAPPPILHPLVCNISTKDFVRTSNLFEMGDGNWY